MERDRTRSERDRTGIGWDRIGREGRTGMGEKSQDRARGAQTERDEPGRARKSCDRSGRAGTERDEPGQSGTSQDRVGGARIEQEEPGSGRRSWDRAGGAKIEQEEPGPGRRSQDRAGGAGARQEELGPSGRSQDRAGGARIGQEELGRSGRCQDRAGGARIGQEEPGSGRRSRDRAGRARIGQEEPGPGRRSWDRAGGARTGQEEPGPGRRSQDRAGGARTEQEEPGSGGRSQDRAGGASTGRRRCSRIRRSAGPGGSPPATLALRSMDGVFLSPTEDEFVGRITEELEQFMVQGQHQRVLLFPPLSSRLRYLIHRTVENMELLSSFSVGEGWRRRTVICHSAVRLPNETSSDQKPGTNPGRAQRPAQPWGRGGRGGTRLRHPGDTHGDNPRSSVGSGRITRPPRKRQDRALFVPKGIRKKANWRDRESPGEEPEWGGENCPKNSTGHSQGKDGGKQQENGAGKGSSEHPLCHEKVPPLGNSQDSCEQEIRDRDCSHSAPGHSQHPPEAEEQEPSHASTKISEFQRQENQPSRNSGGSECGKSSSPLEKHGWTGLERQSRSKSPEQGAQSSRLENQSRSKSPEQGAQSSRLENQSRNKSPEQGTLSSPTLENQEQVEQKPLENVLEGPGEALAAPGDDPQRIHGGKVPREEEEDKEDSDVAEALSRSLDLAAGDKEGTRQSSLEDDTAELLAEIVGNLTVKDISIERISVDYCSYGEAQVTEGDLGHVTEIYDFPSSLKTEDLMEMFSDFHESGFKIQWVDDTHALGIFSSSSTELLQLGKERPQTDTAVARRLVSHALGWRHRQQEAAGSEEFQPESLDQEE
uniref:R3H domain-containing protein n=1 Tax=Catharus ustulatus TaxID=91951 RepID=A0A8C3UAV9_CATUS